MEKQYGPKTAFAEQLDAEKYRIEGESFRDKCGRVAGSLKDNDTHYKEFREIMLDQRFLPAGRVQAAMGAPKNVTPYNCFVSGTIPDSFTTPDNEFQSSIMHRAMEAAQTMRMGGGIGYDFSTLRPRGDLIKKLMSQSSGPLQFMDIFNAVCRATSSSGNRRGAQMGVLRIDHPDVMEFIHSKQNTGSLNGFNISVAVTDDFMECLDSGKPFKTRFGGQVYGELDPAELWENLMRSTWDWAEPGVLFVDTINRMNNLWYCETLAATNPCGEQPLPPFGACLLGSFNLTKYVVKNADGTYHFDLDYLISDIPAVVRAMDNIVDRATYPLPQQEAEAKNKRRMGIGITGLANALEACGLEYGTVAFAEKHAQIKHAITRHAYIASAYLAQEKGAFPLFDKNKFCKGKFFATLDHDVQDLIRTYGLRNSHLISDAPTGTISMTADNISSSIEPVYKYAQEREVIMMGGKQTVPLYDYGFENFRVRGRRSSAGEVTPRQHIRVLLTSQNYTDSAVSKTVNTDGNVPWEDFKDLYLQAYLGGAKGCTTFNKDGKRMGLFKDIPEDRNIPFPNQEPEISDNSYQPEMEVNYGMSCEFDPATGRRSCE